MGLLPGPHAGQIPLACSGHLLVDLPIFMGPIVVLAGWLLLSTRRARRREQLEGAPPPERREHKVAEDLIGVQA